MLASPEKLKVSASQRDAETFLTLKTDVRDYYRIVHLLLNVYMCRLSFKIVMH